MRIGITGSTGLVGKALIKNLSVNFTSAEIVQISRQNGAWDPDKKNFNPDFFKNLDVVIHLAGEGIANKRWSEHQKKLLYKSRIETTEFLASILKSSPLKLFICASGIGYYGSRGDETLIEQSSLGSNYLAELSQAWENAADKVRAERTIKARFGVILAKEGGALKKMLLPFQLGLGGKIGSGKQYMSWISLEDVVEGIKYCIQNKELKGAVNFCSPNPERNEDFSKKLAQALNRPCIFPVPEFVIKTIFGQMGKELLLSSTKAKPDKLIKNGFIFKHASLEAALKIIV